MYSTCNICYSFGSALNLFMYVSLLRSMVHATCSTLVRTYSVVSAFNLFMCIIILCYYVYYRATVNRGNGNLEWKEETENGKRKREMVVTFSTKAVYIICLVLFFVLVVIFIFLDRIVEI